MSNKERTVSELARRLGFRTLEVGNSDRLDFKEVSVALVREVLEAAYEAGRAPEPEKKPVKFTLEIELGNEAMQSACDVARALDTVRGRVIEYGGDFYGLRGGAPVCDINGNTVGAWKIGEDS